MDLSILKNQKIWTEDLLKKFLYQYNSFNKEQLKKILENLNKEYSPENVLQQLLDRASALEDKEKLQYYAKNSTDPYPETINISEVNEAADFSNLAIVLTAGGDGERLIQSLKKEGKDEKYLNSLTKATIPVPEANEKSSLEINLRQIKKIEEKFDIEIPVIVTLGPIGSKTSTLIPSFLEKNSNFGLKNIITLPQFKRIHFTKDEKIVVDDKLDIITNPDETGGPIVRLNYPIEHLGKTAYKWLLDQGTKHILVLQATGIYDYKTLEKFISQKKSADLIAMGILRKEFKKTDCFGTFMNLKIDEKKKLKILESHVIDEKIRSIKNEKGEFLPYNPGLFLFQLDLLKRLDKIPFYATSDKEIKEGLFAPKIGYAATDLTLIAENPKIVLIDDTNFAALIKDADSLANVGRFYKSLEKI